MSYDEIFETVIFLSTSSARRTTKCDALPVRYDDISIHVLREEDDSKCDGK